MSKINFKTSGFVKMEALIPLPEVARLRGIYKELLEDKEKTEGLRSDLGGGDGGGKVEKITQIMRPSIIKPELLEGNAFE